MNINDGEGEEQPSEHALVSGQQSVFAWEGEIGGEWREGELMCSHVRSYVCALNVLVVAVQKVWQGSLQDL